MIKNSIPNILKYLIITMVCVLFLLPIIWLFSKSFALPEKVFIFPPELIPRPFSLKNIVRAISHYNIHKHIGNTTFVTAVTIFGAIFSSSIVAYGFARLRFKGRRILFMVLLSGMMIPWDTTIIPLFIMYSKMGWTDSYLPLIVPTFFCGYSGAFFVFLIRQYMMTIPFSLDEAAIIDGCGHFGIYSRIILPNIKPALATVIIYQFLWSWNDFLNPLVYIDSMKRFTLTMAIYLMQNPLSTDWGAILASAAFACIVPVTVFFISQDRLIGGFSSSGLKE